MSEKENNGSQKWEDNGDTLAISGRLPEWNVKKKRLKTNLSDLQLVP